ncbi:MAG: C4-dicarboxylate ABC transporter permease [Betaproteobacteria bacterium RBG_16_66_20]|nr:MAG: C4-dicarboxylate ABC transporter permease [Betaproteobacteria bacterium RBG_16_66_20]
MQRLAELYGRLLAGLALAGCAVLLLMMLVICADVLLRNVRIVPGMRGVPWANEVTEYALYFITMLTAPWLLRKGMHIRIDVLLRAIPRWMAWYCEWAVDLIALMCCALIAYYGVMAVLSSHAIGGMVVKVLSVPEWWLLAPLPATFALLAIEVLFRMLRLYAAERGPRTDAVSAA